MYANYCFISSLRIEVLHATNSFIAYVVSFSNCFRFCFKTQLTYSQISCLDFWALRPINQFQLDRNK